MAQPEIEVNQITAAPAFDGTNITAVAKLGTNTFTAAQTINVSANYGELELRGFSGARLRMFDTNPGTDPGWQFFASGSTMTLQELTSGGSFAAHSFRVNSGAKLLETDATDIKFDSKALNRANVVTTTINTILTLSHASQYIRVNNVGSRTVTVPTNASVAFPFGTQVEVHRAGTGPVTIVAAGGVTLNVPETLALRKQHSTCTLIKVGLNEWDVVGDMTFA